MRTKTAVCAAVTATMAMSVLLVTPGDSHAIVAAEDGSVGEVVVPSDTACDNVTYIQSASTDNQHRVRSRGVITAFRTLIGPEVGGPVAFKVVRPTASGWRITGSTGLVTAAPSTLVVKAARIPVAAGDGLGMFFAATTDCALIREGYTMAYIPGNGAVGQTSFGEFPGYQLSVAATVEPDADRDRFGDHTQDRCTTDPTTQRRCATSSPRTQIRRVTVVSNGTVRVTFGASERATFRCAVDSPVYSRCRSPLVRRLAPGRHAIGVVATDRYGNTDATPAIARVNVPRR